jgi:sedoheptulose-bisphosphatase
MPHRSTDWVRNPHFTTSFTTNNKKQPVELTSSMDSKVVSSTGKGSGLAALLEETLPPAANRNELRTSILPAIIKAIWEISEALRSSHHVSLAGTANAFGDDQLNVDVASENILRDVLRACPAVATVSSEEDPIERDNNATSESTSHEKYTVAFDPLDGSSIIAPNWSVGTIVGIWDGATAIGENPREKQIVSILGVYGPRATAIVAIRTSGDAGLCFEVALDSNSPDKWIVTHPSFSLAPPPFKTRYFAPANLRAAAEDSRYNQLITNFITEKYTLRYSGGLVPDVVHSLVKGHGIYLSPVTTASAAKLRRLYELCPVALIVECAGGEAVEPRNGKKILDQALEVVDERGGIVCGTASEVEKVMLAFLG